MSKEIIQAVDDLNRDFNEFKKQNDAGNKATADTINAALTKTQDKIEALETAMSRNATAGKVSEVAEMLSSKAGLKALATASKSDSFIADFMSGKTNKIGTGDYAQKTVTGQVGVGADGGYSVPTIIDQLVSLMIVESSPIETLADSVTIGQQDGYHGLIDNNDASGSWVSETGARTQTNANTFTRVDIVAYELFANPRLTLQLIEDAPYGAEAELMKAVGAILARARATAFVNGTGSGSTQPTGFLNTTAYAANDLGSNAPGVQNTNTVTSATSATMAADDVYSLVYSLRDGYQQTGVFAANRLIVEQIRKFKDSYGHYMWNPNYTAGEPASLVGYPIFHFADMPSAVTASALVLTFADWKNFYKIVNRVGLQMLRDPYSVEGQVVFKTRQRVGGGVFNGVAGATLKIHS